MATVLYISYDGLLSPLGQSQVLQYIKGLSDNHKILLISYEKTKDLSNEILMQSIQKEIKLSNIDWIKLNYHKRPSHLATPYDVMVGTFVSYFLIKKHEVNIIHARSYIACLVALIINKIIGVNYIFDMRGFWADEKFDGGVWSKKSFAYKFFKYLECKFFINSSAIVSLTNKGKDAILNIDCDLNYHNQIFVIPTCVNTNIFSPNIVNNVNYIDNSNFTLGYVGSVGTFYLFDEVLKSFNALCSVKSKAKLLIINQGQHSYINNRISAILVDRARVELKSSSYDKISNEINKMNAGIFYIMPSFSKQSSSPTKMGEFLACGKPCLINSSVGDTEDIIKNEGVGVVISNKFSEKNHMDGILNLLKLVDEVDIDKKCVKVANSYFSLERGIYEYDSIYKKIEDQL